MSFPLHRYWELLAQYLQPLKRKVVLLAALIFATIGLQLVNPQIIRYFIDAAIEAGTGDGQARNLLWAALAFLGAALLLQGLGVAATYVSEDVGWRSTNRLREDLTFHCLALDMTFHNEHKPGEMIERIDGDVANIAIFFAQFVVRILGNVLTIYPAPWMWRPSRSCGSGCSNATTCRPAWSSPTGERRCVAPIR